jgi:hypothetical protein
MRSQRGKQGRARIVLSLAASAEFLVPIVIYRRRPDMRPVHTRVTAALILVLLGAAVIWAALWATTWLIRRSPSGGTPTWIVCLALTGVIVALQATSVSGFDSHHVVLLVGLTVFLWLALALVLRVLIALTAILYTHVRPGPAT